MNSLPSEEAVEKIVYLVSIDYNEKSNKRGITEFISAKSKLEEMFKERYENDI